MLIEACVVVFGKGLIVVSPSGKHDGQTSGPVERITALTTLTMIEKRKRLLPQYKDGIRQQQQTGDKAKRKQGRMEHFICVSRSVAAGNVRRRAWAGVRRGPLYAISGDQPNPIGYPWERQESMTGFKESRPLRGCTERSKQGLNEEAVSLVSFFDPSNLRSAGKRSGRLGVTLASWAWTHR